MFFVNQSKVFSNPPNKYAVYLHNGFPSPSYTYAHNKYNKVEKPLLAKKSHSIADFISFQWNEEVILME